MSLASRVANLFSWGTTSDSSGRLGLDEDAGGGKLQSALVVPNAEFRTNQKAESQDISEMDGRPPYLHVRGSRFWTQPMLGIE